MQKHTRIYLKYFGFDESDFVPCEICGAKSVDIHHIDPKGMGGSKKKDYIENLVALCRQHHDMAHASPQFNAHIKLQHRKNLLKFSNNPNDLEKYC